MVCHLLFLILRPHKLGALSHPLTELRMLKLDELLSFFVNILCFCNLSRAHILALRPPHICILEALDRFFGFKYRSELLHRVPMMMIMVMMMRFVTRTGGVSKYHS